MTVDSAGNIGTSLDPGHPAAFQYLSDLIVGVATNYDVDGIHLDYIRYPETAIFGFNPIALQRFARLYNRTGGPPIGQRFLRVPACPGDRNGSPDLLAHVREQTACANQRFVNHLGQRPS